MKLKTKIPTAILTSDWHLRDTTPVSRVDDYQAEQWDKIQSLINLAYKYQCPIIDAGDMFHKWELGYDLFCRLANVAQKVKIFTIYGNHDLPYKNINKCAQSILCAEFFYGGLQRIHNDGIMMNNEIMVYGRDYGGGKPTVEYVPDLIKTNILVTHEMVWHQTPPYPGLDARTNAVTILKKYPEFNLIITGHNHQGFVVNKDNRLLVNPGSMMRMTADQETYKPRYYLWFQEDNTVEPVYYEESDSVFDTTHLVKRKKETVYDNILTIRKEEIKLDYKENIRQYLNGSVLRNKTKRIIEELL